MKLLAAVLLGSVLAFAGAVLLLPLPEVGLPLLLLGLRLLGTRFAWARRANAWVDRQARRVSDRYHRLPGALRALVLIALVAIAALAVIVGIRHLLR